MSSTAKPLNALVFSNMGTSMVVVFIMTPTITRSHRRLITWAIVLVAAVPAAGCKRVEHPITAADRKYCDQTAGVSAAPGSAR